ncbi:MAG TPA: cytochrome P450 [Pseudonocardiaceae bacterium]|jgi:unspecific monooxygenase|nr:cytochrome P450 [Pseudonocardiaceae bacterium]
MTLLRPNDQGWTDLATIPHARYRIPLAGDLIGASPATPVQTSMRLARELGPIFRRKIFSTEFVLVSGADLVADLVDESRFGKHVGLGVENLRSIGGDGLFTAYNSEPNWQRAHDILAPGFTRSAMERYHPTMLTVAHQLMDSWDQHLDGTAVNVTGDATRLTLETIARTGFGQDLGSFDRAEPHPFVTAMIGALRFALDQNATPPVIGPLLTRNARRRNTEDRRYLFDFVDKVIRARQDSGDTAAEDLLGLMLNTRHPETGQRLSAANIAYQVVTFLVAGHETTSGALSFALYYLAKHPEIQATAQSEVDQVWGDSGDPDYAQVSKLRYVRRVLDESLRLWPTAPGFAREALADTTIGGGRYRMRKGASAIVLAPMLHRDPAVWGADAESFDPDRFAPEAVRARPGHVYKPFGAGARACIGRQFALHEATLVLGLLLRRYQLHGQPDYRLKVTERLTLTPEDFTLNLTRRSPATKSTVDRTAITEPAQ